MLSLRAGGGSFDSLLGSAPVRTTVLVTEGLPPIPAKLLERIRRWEFIDLAQLVFDASKDDPGIRQQPPSEGILIVQSMEQMQCRRKAVNDIFTWSKAFAIYAAALSGAELTTKEECAGLWAPSTWLRNCRGTWAEACGSSMTASTGSGQQQKAFGGGAN